MDEFSLRHDTMEFVEMLKEKENKTLYEQKAIKLLQDWIKYDMFIAEREFNRDVQERKGQ